MTEPARAQSDLDIEAARARDALIPRIRKGDLDALAEFFTLGGATVRSIGWVEPPRA